MFKKKFFLKNVLAGAACLAAMMTFSGCGNGSGSGGSKLKKNEYLGSLPGICVDYEAKKATFEEKWQKKGEKVTDQTKAMKLMAEYEKEEKAMKEQFNADYKSELGKIVGKEIPVTFSEALQSSGEDFYNVAPVKVVDEGGKPAATISLSAKNNFDVPKMKGYDYGTYFRFVTKDGETILASVLLPVKLEYQAFSVSANQHLLDNNYPLSVSNKSELWANFAGIEFITKEEYDLLTNK